MFEFNDSDFNILPDKKNKDNCIIHNFEQGSDEWFIKRLGKITASNIYLLRGNSKTRTSLLR